MSATEIMIREEEKEEEKTLKENARKEAILGTFSPNFRGVWAAPNAFRSSLGDALFHRIRGRIFGATSTTY